MSVTREQIEAGEREFHENHEPEARRIVRWRANGRLKTWVTRPREWVLPIKFGLRGYSYMTETNADQFHTARSCVQRDFPEAIPFEISQEEIERGERAHSLTCPAVWGIMQSLQDMGYGEDVVVQVGRQQVNIWHTEPGEGGALGVQVGDIVHYAVPREMREWTRKLDTIGKAEVGPASFEIVRTPFLGTCQVCLRADAFESCEHKMPVCDAHKTDHDAQECGGDRIARAIGGRR